MNRCKTCKHFSPESNPYWAGLGSCSRWHAGYHVKREEIADNEVLVENDEGWGAYVGPEFGCVLHEAKS